MSVQNARVMDVTIRRADREDAHAIAEIHVAAWKATYRGMLPDEEFDKRPLEVRQKAWREWFDLPRHLAIVACDAQGDVVGFAGGWMLEGEDAARFDAYLSTLYLRPDVKGRGIGKALIYAFAREVESAGARSLVLRTLRLNPARNFYEKLGARLVPEAVHVDAGVFDDDLVYAFDDLRVLIH